MSEEKKRGRPMPGTSGQGNYSVDLNEYGAERDGKRQQINRRLFVQLLAFQCPNDMACADTIASLGKALDGAGVSGVIYENVNDPSGFALVVWSDDPTSFVTELRPVLAREPFRQLQLQPEYTMLGRTYSSGYEPRLEYWIIDRPIENLTGESGLWSVWYPLKRSGAFARLPGRDQGGILREHAVIGRAYGEQGLASDIRLACHGLDKNDNDFVIGLLGKELFPLSHVVQTMRKTRQTSEFITQMGPFFVGHRVWSSS